MARRVWFRPPVQLLKQQSAHLSPPAPQERCVVEFECIWCHRRIEVDRAGWPYVHSVALLHFHMCPSRPVNVTPDTIEAAAARVADELEKQGCGNDADQ